MGTAYCDWISQLSEEYQAEENDPRTLYDQMKGPEWKVTWREPLDGIGQCDVDYILPFEGDTPTTSDNDEYSSGSVSNYEFKGERESPKLESQSTRSSSARIKYRYFVFTIPKKSIKKG